MSIPKIKALDEILVDGRVCIVHLVMDSAGGDGTAAVVVLNPDKPTTREICWDEGWRFVASDDFGGYGRESDASVVKLRRISGWFKGMR